MLHTPSVRLVAGLSAALLCGSVLARAQAGKPIVIDDARPLSAVVHEFEKRHGVVVTYEDPLYLFPGDVVDVTLQVRHGKTFPRIIVPLGGPFQFDYEEPDLRAPGGTSTGRRISWRLFCGPEPRFCALNFHGVEHRVEREAHE